MDGKKKNKIKQKISVILFFVGATWITSLIWDINHTAVIWMLASLIVILGAIGMEIFRNDIDTRN